MATRFAYETAEICWRGWSSLKKAGMVAMAVVFGKPGSEHHRWQAVMGPKPRGGDGFRFPLFWAINHGIPLNETEARGLFPEHTDIWYDDGTCIKPPSDLPSEGGE